MDGRWTFGRKLAVGFAAIVLLTLAISATAIYALRSVIASKDEVINRYTKNLIELKTLSVATDRKSAAIRGYLLTGHQPHLDDAAARRVDAIESIGCLRGRVALDREGMLVDQIERAAAEHHVAAERVAEVRRAGGTAEAVSRAFDEQMSPKRAEVVQAIDTFAAEQERALADAQLVAAARAESASTLMIILCAAAALLASIAASLLTRTLGREIGGAVGKVQSSSSELQAAATQQATGAREQATSMTEISTTITELLATSRQIADTARGVASIAEQTAAAARAGDHTVQGAKDSMGIIRVQTDLMVGHVVELGKKSQRIGAVADIVSELAEQTNILAINATIEAAGAGEAGKRFAVVADEIRKLADRVGGSTKEIRGLIDDVRTAVNTSVMATEMGSKTVDAAARQFVDVATSFTDIARLVSTTTDATREIELSTKQQTTAVEQVNVAIANAAQATKETEASSGQTLQTASHLAALSSELSLLVRTPAA